MRGLARPSRRLAVRRARHGHEGLLDDRLRARAQRAAGDRRRGRVRRSETTSPRSGRSRRTSRRSSRSTAARCARDRVDVEPLTPRQVDELSATRARCSSMCAPTSVRRRPHPRRDLQPGGARRLRHEARLDRRPRPGGRFIGRDDEDARRRALAAAVGVRRVAGYLAGGMTSWREEKRPTRVVRAHRRRGAARAAAARSRSSTSASGASGTRATSPARSHVPYHDIDGSRSGSTRRARSPSICSSGPAQRSRRRRCSCATARRTSSTSPTAASGRGSGWAGRSSARASGVRSRRVGRSR